MNNLSEVTSLLIIVIPILGGVIVNIIVAIKTNTKIDSVSSKADVITTHVNGNAEAAAARITAMQQEIAGLRQLLSDNKQTAALLAQTTATNKKD